MGTKVNAQIHHNSEYVTAVQEMSHLIWKKTRLPWLRLKPIWYLTGNGAQFDKYLKLLTDFTRKVSFSVLCNGLTLSVWKSVLSYETH